MALALLGLLCSLHAVHGMPGVVLATPVRQQSEAAQAAIHAIAAATVVHQRQTGASSSSDAGAAAFAQTQHSPEANEDESSEIGTIYEFSITFAMNDSSDVNPAWLNLFLKWMQTYCVYSIASLERGRERNNLHIQAAVAIRLTAPPDTKYCNLMKKKMKEAFCSVIN